MLQAEIKNNFRCKLVLGTTIQPHRELNYERTNNNNKFEEKNSKPWKFITLDPVGRFFFVFRDTEIIVVNLVPDSCPDSRIPVLLLVTESDLWSKVYIKKKLNSKFFIFVLNIDQFMTGISQCCHKSEGVTWIRPQLLLRISVCDAGTNV